jgi:hypothetical protein
MSLREGQIVHAEGYGTARFELTHVFGTRRFAAIEAFDIGRKHAQPMVDRAWMSGLLRTPRANSALLRTSRELRDVDGDSLTSDMVGIAARGVEPTEKMREANRVSALRVDRTIAQAQLR